MPYYNYICEKCGAVTPERRPSNEMNNPAICKECGGNAKHTYMGQTFGGVFGDNDKYRSVLD